MSICFMGRMGRMRGWVEVARIFMKIEKVEKCGRGIARVMISIGVGGLLCERLAGETGAWMLEMHKTMLVVGWICVYTFLSQTEFSVFVRS